MISIDTSLCINEWKWLIPFDGRANKSSEYAIKRNDEIANSNINKMFRLPQAIQYQR